MGHKRNRGPRRQPRVPFPTNLRHRPHIRPTLIGGKENVRGSRDGLRVKAFQGHAASRMGAGFAGTPTTTAPVDTSRVTTALAPTTAPSPMVTPGRIITPRPIQTLQPTVIGAAS